MEISSNSNPNSSYLDNDLLLKDDDILGIHDNFIVSTILGAMQSFLSSCMIPSSTTNTSDTGVNSTNISDPGVQVCSIRNLLLIDPSPYGLSGGKELVIALSRQLKLNYVTVNTGRLYAEGKQYADISLKQSFQKALSLQPCIFIIENIEAMFEEVTFLDYNDNQQESTKVEIMMLKVNSF